MRAELAQRLLNEVMGWTDDDSFRQYVPDLQALAEAKYDEYGNYGPGSKFIENLAGWLNQFPEVRRTVALDFVMARLVFVSETEMRHLVDLVPNSIIDRVLRSRVAEAHEIPAYRVAEIEGNRDFVTLRRRSLVLGASDGARLDHLRRASGLSHEQFLQTPAPSAEQIKKLVEKMAKAEVLEDSDHRFEHVFLVDDFSGSGKTLLRKSDKAGEFEGKVAGLRQALDVAAAEGLVAPDVPGTVVLYCASEQAQEQIAGCLTEMGATGWTVDTVQLFPHSLRVTETDPAMELLCRDFFDSKSIDSDKGEVPIGYSECALPVVLSHNAPNNSVCLLWLDTRDQEGSDNRRALFPRYERHHPDRR
ncbi:phosphoribosyltransferase-like protein [Baekduia sp.]|jgi:hypothetical protein|uniref:phosphoribosyltransferase-like protein n=1 Tax=Baekduia sp. TaxID=2600305 RepID=UPI002E035092|nr:hypothetical protein [Baekduia sp.]